jgi:glutathione S-transferase
MAAPDLPPSNQEEGWLPSNKGAANPYRLTATDSRAQCAGAQPLGANAMHAVPATLISAAVTILSVLFVFYTGMVVGQMRSKHKIDAPAVAGNPEFERAYRVQVNTLEQFVIFLPLLWLATTYFTTLPWLPAVMGLIWIVGRFMYMQGYIAEAGRRGTGFLVTILASAVLLILSIIGIVQTWMAVTAS